MKKLSNLGCVTRLLQISSTELSRYLHVDVSLVSKWKRGTRQLTNKSGYYDEVVTYLLDANFKLGNRILQNFFDQVYPDEEKNNLEDVNHCLVRFLNDTYVAIPNSYRDEQDALYTAEISIYGEQKGRRKAIDQLLAVASKQEHPCKMITIDCEQFQWLVEDEAYAASWTTRMYELLESGFTLEMIFHFSLYQENFVQLFISCGKVLFHKNVLIYYHKYFDEDIYWFSFFCLEHTMSVMGLSMSKGQSYSTVFTDTYSIMQHQGIVEFVKKSCNPMFRECSASYLLNKPTLLMAPIVYCNFYIPEIFFIKELLLEVLEANHVDQVVIQHCITLHDSLLSSWNTQVAEHVTSRMIFFYSNRIINEFQQSSTVPCDFLSYLIEKPIFMNGEQFQRLSTSTKQMIAEHPHMMGCFLDEEEERLVPSEYCFCSQDTWLFTLHTDYAKLSTQSTLLDTSTVVFEQAWRKIPSIRKIS
ncbi:MAG: hypothetical protein RSA90_03165 [Lachnospiraceae bacterium]